MKTSTLIAQHDAMLATKPDDIEHVASECPICLAKSLEPTHQGDAHMEPSQEDLEKLQAAVQAAVDAAVAAATAPLQATIDKLAEESNLGELLEAIDAAVAPVKTERDEVQVKLDEAVAKATASEQSLADTLAYLQAEAEAAEAAQKLAETKDERVKEATEAAVFPEEYIEENADRFAAMSDEVWATTLDAAKTAAESVGPATRNGVPRATDLQATRSSGGAGGGKGKSALGNISTLHRTTRTQQAS